MKRYDYKGGNGCVLSAGRKGASLRLPKGFKNSLVLFNLGEQGYLKGKARRDYLKMKAGGFRRP